jgi:hypothetical protein
MWRRDVLRSFPTCVHGVGIFIVICLAVLLSLTQHASRAFRIANAEIKGKAEKEGGKPASLKPWVPNSFWHTFLTGVGASGSDAWTLARIAGHSSIAISSRYVHPS